MENQAVLIVEDEIFVAMDIERILSGAGYRVVGIAADQGEAMNVATAPSIAFVDINLRDGPTGPRIAQHLAERHGTRVVYVTANPGQIEPRAATALGYIRKPFDDAAILSAAAVASQKIAPDDAPESLVLYR